MADFFEYGEKEIAHLKRADWRMAEVIERIGRVERQVIPDLFTALVHSIVGQQISTKAHETIWNRMVAGLGEITPQAIARLAPEELPRFGISSRKADYIQRAARKIANGEFDIEALRGLDDAEVCRRLCSLDGIGTWSAEMLMLFSMQRPDILSFDDLGIQRGLRMVFHHRQIDRRLFEKYRRRFSPYGSVASLYLWAVAGGAVDGMKDYAPTRKPTLPRKPAPPSKNIIHTARYHAPCGDLLLGSIGGRLCLCDWLDSRRRAATDRRLRTWLQAYFVEDGSDVVSLAARQLDEYFAGSRREFDVPLQFAGSEFQQSVWQSLTQLPYGATISYGELARRIGNGKAVRAVANANGANALSIFVPCHRVVANDGKLTGYAGGLAAKRFLLELEQKFGCGSHPS